jgi:nucleoid-associated protein EbfC
MSKGKFRPTPGLRGGAPGGGMMQQIQRLQEDMAKAQDALEQETVEITVGGGAVKLVMTGHQKVQSLTIDPSALDPTDLAMLQDMLIAAFNEGVERSQALASERMGALTGGLNIPGLF